MQLWWSQTWHWGSGYGRHSMVLRTETCAVLRNRIWDNSRVFLCDRSGDVAVGRFVWKGSEMNTIAGFIIGGLICGPVGFIVAACLGLEHNHDAQKVYEAGYMDGYDDGAHLKECKYGTY